MSDHDEALPTPDPVPPPAPLTAADVVGLVLAALACITVEGLTAAPAPVTRARLPALVRIAHALTLLGTVAGEDMLGADALLADAWHAALSAECRTRNVAAVRPRVHALAQAAVTRVGASAWRAVIRSCADAVCDELALFAPPEAHGA